MITPSNGVKNREIGAPYGGTARGGVKPVEGGSFSSLLRRPSRQVQEESANELGATKEFEIECAWDPETPIVGAGRTDPNGGEGYLPVTKTYDELPRFELDEEVLGAYEPVTTEYRYEAALRALAPGVSGTGRVQTKVFGSGTGVDETESEYEPRTTEFRTGPGPTRVLGSGDFWSALTASAARGATRESAHLSVPLRWSGERPRIDHLADGIKKEHRIHEVGRIERYGRFDDDVSPVGLKVGTALRGLVRRRRLLDGRLWAAAGLIVTLVLLSWMILLVR